MNSRPDTSPAAAVGGTQPADPLMQIAPRLDADLAAVLLARIASSAAASPAPSPSTGSRPRADASTLAELLRFVEAGHHGVVTVLRRLVPDLASIAPASPRELARLMQGSDPCGPVAFDEALRAVLNAAARRGGTDGFLRWRVAPPLGATRAHWYRLLESAIGSAVPGQAHAVSTLARSLALQLADPSRDRPVVAFLSGPLGGGARQAASAVACVLAAQGWGRLDLEMSQIRCEEEASEIDGSQPYWKGARPGKVTSAVYRRPKTVVVLHDIDHTLPKVHESLVPALRDGRLVDNFGLGPLTDEQRRESNGRDSTGVDMREAVLLFTASHGHDLWNHADLGDMLDAAGAGDGRDVRDTVFAAMRTGTRVYRGREMAMFDHALLVQLEPHIVLFKPLRWAAMQHAAGAALTQACAAASRRLACTIEIDSAAREALATAYLAMLGARANLDRITPDEVAGEMLAPLDDALVDATLGRAGTPPALAQCERVTLTMPEPDRATMAELLAPFAAEPQRQLARRRLALRLTPRLEVVPDLGRDEDPIATPHRPVAPPGVSAVEAVVHARLAFAEPRLVQVRAVDDYLGDTALAAFVPDLGFDDIAGQTEAKQHLRRIIELYARADRLHAEGHMLPRGAVLCGPAGTGKTMLAQAMASEAAMSFVPTNGTELMDPARIRRVFDLARRSAPSIVFIDEIDTLGTRGKQSMVHDAAINALLAAMQGFDQRAPVFVLAATNREQALDPALVRPGRLERLIRVGSLDRQGRELLVDQLLAVLPDAERDAPDSRDRLLAFSHGMTGAELSAVVRDCRLEEAMARGAVDAPRRARLDDVLERLTASKYGEKLDKTRRDHLRERVAYHEAGHAVLHALWFPQLAIEQVTITARASSEGFMAINAEESGGIVETAQAVQRYIGVLLGGRLAELRRYGPALGASSGGADDLRRARTAAFVAVAHRGMDPEIGLLSLAATDDEDRALMPEALKHQVFERVGCWIEESRREAAATIDAYWPVVDALARDLVRFEYVAGSHVQALLGRHAPQLLPSAPPALAATA